MPPLTSPATRFAKLLPRRGLSLVLVLGSAATAGAQRSTVDEGTLLVSQRGVAIGRESFRIQESQETGRLFLANAQIAYGESRITSSLTADANGTALLYKIDVLQGGRPTEELKATARPGRLSAIRRTAQRESSKEYVVGQGAVVLDEGALHQHALLALAGHTGPLTVVVPRAGTQQTATLEQRGTETITVDRQQVAATRWSITLPDGAHDFWADARGRLLRVEIQSRGLVAVRDELPR